MCTIQEKAGTDHERRVFEVERVPLLVEINGLWPGNRWRVVRYPVRIRRRVRLGISGCRRGGLGALIVVGGGCVVGGGVSSLARKGAAKGPRSSTTAIQIPTTVIQSDGHLRRFVSRMRG
jgi:hypothetical protein